MTLSEGVVAVDEDITAAGASVVAVSRVRPLTFMDVDWFMDMGLRRYPVRWDPVGTEFWLRNKVLPNPTSHLAIRSGRAACVTILTAQPWLPSDWEALVTTVMAEEGAMWETIPLLRASRDWAKRKRCVTWKMASETTFDLGPLAKRVGAVEGEPYYQIDWRGERWAKDPHSA